MQNKSALVAVIFALLVFVGGGLNAYADIPANERAALIALYDSTNGDNWTDNSGWKDGELAADGFAMPGTEGSWHGITLNAEGTFVDGIHLGKNNLDGTIPASLGNLANLRNLYLHSNSLTGPLPAELGNLSNLGQLYLNNNQISGEIPPELGNLANLSDLSLYLNELEGSIPPEFGNLTNLRHLRLFHNQLTGSIPSELGNLSNLQELGLYNNQLTGNIPSELGNLTSAKAFYLDHNQLTGSIPPELGNLTTVTGLSLNDNQLTGGIPSALGNLTRLTSISLYNNQLTGSIPSEIGNLINLEYLDFSQNDLDGTIPVELENLSNLEKLKLYENQLEGGIPVELGNLTALEELQLYTNRLEGTIPSELGNLVHLTILFLHGNELSGEIPQELGNLVNLQALYLHANELTGTLPSELGSLTNLQYLLISHNRLMGNIPSEWGNLTNLKQLRLNGNRLTGSIPTSLTNLTSLTLGDVSYNGLYTDDDTLRAFLNNLDWDWADSQTVAPEDVSVGYLSNESLKLTWTPISYTDGEGGYLVMYSETPGGPYTLFDQTANKSISQMNVTGLDPNTAYYFVVQTQTDAKIQNQNTVISDYSQETVAATQMVKGDVYWDGKIDLRDAIAALQILDAVYPGTSIHDAADVNGDGKIGLPEALFALRSCLGLIYVDEETKDSLQEVVDCVALAMDESTKDAETMEKMTGLSVLIGLADAQAAAGGGVAGFIDYLLNDLEFPCGEVTREPLPSKTIVFTFTGQPACNNVTGTIKVTPELPDSTLSYNVEYIDVQTEGCLIDGDAATTMTIEGSVVTATHTFDQMSMCGDEFDGTVTVVYNIVTGEVISVSTEQNAYTIEGCDGTMDLVISYNPEDGINGTATITMDEGTYEMEMSNIRIDETCGLPTSGSMTMDGIVLDFSNTSCGNPVVMVTMEGQTFNLNLETGEIS